MNSIWLIFAAFKLNIKDLMMLKLWFCEFVGRKIANRGQDSSFRMIVVGFVNRWLFPGQQSFNCGLIRKISDYFIKISLILKLEITFQNLWCNELEAIDSWWKNFSFFMILNSMECPKKVEYSYDFCDAYFQRSDGNKHSKHKHTQIDLHPNNFFIFFFIISLS